MQAIGKGWKIGIVIPWFGKNLKGGAEQQAWQIASRLRNIGCKVTALSTCSQSFLSKWHVNYYRAGHHKEDGIDVIRFPVAKRNAHQFNKVVGKLLSIPPNQLKPGLIPITEEEEQTYWQENINSPDLISHLKKEQESYDFFIFLPYLFPSTIQGIEAVSEKSLLQPCLHDECYAYLSETLQGMYKCKGLLFNSKGEYHLAKNIYGDWIEDKSFVVGEGIEHVPMCNNYTPNKALPDHYILYLGRKCREKNTPLLLECFDRYCRENPSSKLSLVIAGPENVPLPDNNKRILDLGVVDKELKSYLLAHSKALINPSINESFSRVIFESWNEGRPIIVHKHCLATFEALKDSGFSGWYVSSKEDFQSLFSRLEKTTHKEVLQLGKKGQVYAKKMSDWDEVMNRYITCFNSISPHVSKNHTTDLTKLLLVVPQTSLNHQEQVDLDQFLQAICPKGHWQIELLTRNDKISDAFRCLPNITICRHNSATLTPSLIIWYGDEIWDKGLNLIKGLKASILRKNLLYQTLEEVKVASTQLVPIKEKSSQVWSCPKLFPLTLLQKEECDSRKFESYNRQGINILILANLQNPDFSIITGILQEFASQYAVQINILMPELMSKANSLKIEDSGSIKWSVFSCSKNNRIPSYIYQVCDCMLLIHPVEMPPWFSIGACSYNLPVLKLSNTKEGKDDFFTLKPQIKQSDKILAFLKLVCKSVPVIENLQNINHNVLKSYIPGHFHSIIDHSLQEFSERNRVSQ